MSEPQKVAAGRMPKWRNLWSLKAVLGFLFIFLCRVEWLIGKVSEIDTIRNHAGDLSAMWHHVAKVLSPPIGYYVDLAIGFLWLGYLVMKPLPDNSMESNKWRWLDSTIAAVLVALFVASVCFAYAYQRPTRTLTLSSPCIAADPASTRYALDDGAKWKAAKDLHDGALYRGKDLSSCVGVFMYYPSEPYSVDVSRQLAEILNFAGGQSQCVPAPRELPQGITIFAPSRDNGDLPTWCATDLKNRLSNLFHIDAELLFEDQPGQMKPAYLAKCKPLCFEIDIGNGPRS